MRVRTRGDLGSTHTLEIFLAITIMFATVSTLAAFDTGGGSARPAIERMMTTKAQDSVAMWSEWDLPSEDECAPKTLLEKLVRDGLKEDHARWNEIVAARFGPAYDVDLVLDNYDDILPLHGSGRVVGSTGIANWAPDQTYSLPMASLSAASGTERMRIDAPVVQFGALAKPKGEAIRYGVEFASGTTTTSRVAWGVSGMMGDSAEELARRSASAVLWRAGSSSAFVWELDEFQVAPSAQTAVNLLLDVAASDLPDGTAGTIPVGTVVNVTFPAGWHDAAWVADTLAPWVDDSPASNGGNLVLRARLPQTASPSKTLEFSVYAPASPVRPFDVITARVSQGSLAESNLVAVYPITSTDRSTPRLLVPTTPYAMRAGDTAVFGAALANGGDAIEVTRFTIQIPAGYDLARNLGEGAPLFAPFDPNVPPRSFPQTGWTWKDARAIEWVADPDDPVTIPALKAQHFWIELPIVADPKLGTSLESAYHDGPNATVEFSNGFAATSRSWGKAPGIVSVLVPPATRADNDPLGPTADGYPWSGDSLLLGQSRTFETTGRSQVASVEGEGSYVLRPGASDAVNLENAMANASFEVMTRKVPVGTRLRADGDLGSILATLQQLGVESELALELYSPPSLGCAPTATWRIDTNNLPTPAILHTMIWDAGEPTPSVFVTTDDGYVYRLGETGSPVWARQLAGKATSLDRMDLGPDERYLLVGTSTGKAQVLDALDGSVAWTRVIAAGSGTSQVLPAAAVRYDPQSGRVVAAAGMHLVVLSPASGAEIGGTLLATPVIDLVPSPVGLFVQRTGNYSRVDPNDPSLKPLHGEDVVTTGLLANADRLIVSEGTAARVRDPITLALEQTISYPRVAIRTARGDATGDGVADLVVALDDHSLLVINGATGQLAWTEEPPFAVAPVVPPDPFGTPPSDLTLPSVDACTPSSSPPTYGTSYICGGADAGSELAALAAGGSRAALAKRTGDQAHIAQSSSGPAGWDDTRIDGDPSALSIGPWLTHAHAVAYGNKEGKVVLYGDTGATIFASEPTDRAGTFSFYMVVPEGGFFGSHLLVARLSWEQGGVKQEARLLDWFEAVAADGSPVLNPAYLLSLTVGTREDPPS